MDMSTAANLLARKASQKAGESAHVVDLQLMLALASARQAKGFTAMRAREKNLPERAGDQPERMAIIFAPSQIRPCLPRGMSGAFNAAVAMRLSMGDDGESIVYSGI